MFLAKFDYICTEEHHFTSVLYITDKAELVFKKFKIINDARWNVTSQLTVVIVTEYIYILRMYFVILFIILAFNSIKINI